MSTDPLRAELAALCEEYEGYTTHYEAVAIRELTRRMRALLAANPDAPAPGLVAALTRMAGWYDEQESYARLIQAGEVAADIRKVITTHPAHPDAPAPGGYRPRDSVQKPRPPRGGSAETVLAHPADAPAPGLREATEDEKAYARDQLRRAITSDAAQRRADMRAGFWRGQVARSYHWRYERKHRRAVMAAIQAEAARRFPEQGRDGEGNYKLPSGRVPCPHCGEWYDRASGHMCIVQAREGEGK